MKRGGSVVALTFESRFAYPYYNWMGVNKAALEATVRALARRHGRDLIRVNAISSGPVATKAAKSIPHFALLARTWRKMSPLPWDVHGEKDEVANAAAFLLGPLSKKDHRTGHPGGRRRLHHGRRIDAGRTPSSVRRHGRIRRTSPYVTWHRVFPDAYLVVFPPSRPDWQRAWHDVLSPHYVRR
jgi:hypothetical protein